MANKIITKLKSISLAQLFATFLLFVSLITIICVFVPFSPTMPSAGLDSSWTFGMNQAMSQGLSIGNDVIFTFGPYASIYTTLYSPSTDVMMIIGSIFLAFSYWICFMILIKKVRWYWVLAYCVVLVGLMYSRDALFFSLPLLVGLTTYKILFWEEGKLLKNRLVPFYMALIFIPFGLLPLVKGTMIIVCVVIALLCSVILVANKQKFLAVICLLSPTVSMLIFWITSGQSITNLPSYFISMVPIISGYTEAMASNGPTHELVLYIIASVILLLVISTQKKIAKVSKIFLLCLYFIFLFLSFKEGFVRHDGHAVIAGISILIAALSLPFILNKRIVFFVIFFTLLSWYSIDSNYVKTSPESFVGNIKSTYSLAWDGIKNRIENKDWLKIEFNTTVKSLRDEASFPILPGTTDIYSYDQSYLIASGNTWSPRPVFKVILLTHQH